MSVWFRTYGFAGVHERLIVGALPQDGDDVRLLDALGVTRVLNLVEDTEYEKGGRRKVERALDDAGIVEARLSTVDFGGISPALLDAAVDEVNTWLDRGEVVYVHCRAGWQRSATVAAGVVAVRDDITPDLALQRVQAMKESADPLPHQREDLQRWWDARQSAV
jgi:atypical dual specificity phosphatase